MALMQCPPMMTNAIHLRSKLIVSNISGDQSDFNGVFQPGAFNGNLTEYITPTQAAGF